MAITDQSLLRVGQKVYYQPSWYSEDEWENGIIKEIPDHSFEHVRVVFKCNGDWKNFEQYTSQLTSLDSLFLGWKHESKTEMK